MVGEGNVVEREEPSPTAFLLLHAAASFARNLSRCVTEGKSSPIVFGV